MKKVISVAMASAMVLGMGANAFAVSYNTGANDTAAWPSSFRFEEDLFVIDKDGKFVTDSGTGLNDSQNYDFQVGDEIYMPLSANNQIIYGVEGASKDYPSVAKRTITLAATTNNSSDNAVSIYQNGNVDPDKAGSIAVGNFSYVDASNNVLYYYGYANGEEAYANLGKTYTEKLRGVAIPAANITAYNAANKATNIWNELLVDSVSWETITITEVAALGGGLSGNFTSASGKVYSAVWSTDGAGLTADEVIKNTKALEDAASDSEAQAPTDPKNVTTAKVQRAKAGTVGTATLRVNLPAVASQSGSDGKFVPINKEDSSISQDMSQATRDGIYTGNIDKNWSINLVEDTHSAGKVTDIVKSAEFYRATPADVASYPDAFEAKGVYVKVSLKSYFDSVDSADLKYYCYVARNNGTTDQKTNQVWVAGTYKNNGTKDVDFKWTNNANEPAVWKVKKGENGTAVFDFKDQAFFTVKMYSEEKMYLDMDAAYQKAVANEWDADFDSFYKFKGTNANFAREGELILQSDDANLSVYEVTVDGDLIPVEASYVKDYQLTHTSSKISGYVFNTKELGNYVLSIDELEPADEEVVEDEIEEPDVEELPEVKEPEETPVAPDNGNKNNPSTGADDFVGVAVALAVVSVAAAGALALKK